MFNFFDSMISALLLYKPFTIYGLLNQTNKQILGSPNLLQTNKQLLGSPTLLQTIKQLLGYPFPNTLLPGYSDIYILCDMQR